MSDEEHVRASELIGAPGILAPVEDGMKTSILETLCRVVSDDRGGEIAIEVGGKRLILSAWNAQTLGEDIAWHSRRVKQGLMVIERVEDIK